MVSKFSSGKRGAGHRPGWEPKVFRGGRADGDDESSRVIPYSAEAEECLLSCCLMDGASTIDRCLQKKITAESFHIAANRVIFGKMVDVYRLAPPVTIEVLAEELKTAKLLDEVGGYAYLMQVTARVPTTIQADYFADKVRELQLRRQLIRASTSAIDECYAFDGAVDVFVERIQRQFVSLTDELLPSHAKFPEITPWNKFMAAKLPEPPAVVHGLFHQGGRMILAGGSKSFKTWCLLDLALSVATGKPWWGMATERGRVLYVGFELEAWSVQSRLFEIAKAKAITEAEWLDTWNLAGHATDVDTLMPAFLAKLGRGQYSLVILDPVYVCLGERDENSNSEVTDFMNKLSMLAHRTGAGVAFGHHFSKGNQAEKSAKDRASGAGAWIRAPDTVVTLTPHEQDDCFVADFVLRNFRPKASSVVRWLHPCMQVAPGLDPGQLKGPGRPKEHTADTVLEVLRKAPRALSYSEWMGRAKEREVSESTFKRRLRELLSAGKVNESDEGKYWPVEA